MISVKILIWLLCFFVVSVIQTAAREAGVILGAIPAMLLFGLAWWSAKKLCALWDQRQAEKAALAVSESPIPAPLPAEQEPTITAPSSSAPATPKLRFCKHCGSPIDPATRQCTGCGKQYFRPPVLRKKHLAIAAGVLVCAAVVFLVFNLVSSLAAQKDAAQAQVDDLNARITELESTVAEKERQIEVYKRNEDAYRVKLTRKSEEYDKLREENTMYRDLLGFYEEYVACIGDTGDMIYHRFPCPYMEMDSGWVIFSVPFAESQGYDPCPYCRG